LALKFKHKCDNHEEWASGKEEMLRSQDFKKLRLNELKVGQLGYLIMRLMKLIQLCIAQVSYFQLQWHPR
jgi:hypothetical protein